MHRLRLAALAAGGFALFRLFVGRCESTSTLEQVGDTAIADRVSPREQSELARQRR